MMNIRIYLIVLTLLSIFLFLVPNVCMAYIGPGAGLSAIGALIALIVAIIAAVFGFIWYPVKRFIGKIKN